MSLADRDFWFSESGSSRNRRRHYLIKGKAQEALADLPTSFTGVFSALITDPPYGIDAKSKWATTAEGKEAARKISNDKSITQALDTFQAAFEAAVPLLASDCDAYIFCAQSNLPMWGVFLDDLLTQYGFTRYSIICWEKARPSMGNLDSPWGTTEFIYYYSRKPVPYVARRSPVAYHSPIEPSMLIHPHQKPESLLNELMQASTRPGQWVLDPFAGSASLVRAAMATDRQSLAIECDSLNFSKAMDSLNNQGVPLF